MKWKLARARTTKMNLAITAPRHYLEHYCRDLNGWPRSCMGLEKDRPPGEQLLALLRPFLQYLAASSELSPKTIQKRVDNMWALGSEFIRDLNDDPSMRKRPIEHEYGGPLLYHSDDDQQRSFDSRCRKSRRFLSETAR
jgi:hypothetical protein